MKEPISAIKSLQKALEERIFKLLSLEQLLEDKRAIVRDCQDQIDQTNLDIVHLENAIKHLGQLPE